MDCAKQVTMKATAGGLGFLGKGTEIAYLESISQMLTYFSSLFLLLSSKLCSNLPLNNLGYFDLFHVAQG